MKMKSNKFLLGSVLALSLAAAVLLNLCVALASGRFGLRLDLTADRLYALTDTTADVLDQLVSPVVITVFSPKEDFVQLLREVLSRYDTQGGKQVEVRYINPYQNPSAAQEYQRRGYPVSLNTIVVEGGGKIRTLEMADLFEIDQQAGRIKSMSAEQQLTSAILYTTVRGNRDILFTDGHNEQPSAALESLFLQNNFTTGRVTLSVGEIPAGAALLVIAAPDRDFSAAELSRLDTYLGAGGRLMVFLHPAAVLPRLEAFLAEWGIGATDKLVADRQAYTDANPLRIVPVYAAHPITQFFADNRVFPLLPQSRALEQLFVKQGGVNAVKVLYSSGKSYAKSSGFTSPSYSAGDAPGPFALAMSAEKELGDDRQARVFVCGSREIYADDLMQTQSYSNADFLLQAANWCTDTQVSVNIPVKSVSDRPIAVVASQGLLLTLVFVLLLPGGVFVFGLARVLRRRGR